MSWTINGVNYLFWVTAALLMVQLLLSVNKLEAITEFYWEVKKVYYL